MASTLLTRAGSIKRPKLPHLRRSIQATFGNDGGAYEMNEYIHKNFFHADNYQSILKCLDDGYDVMTEQLEYMQEYCDLLKNFIESLTSYSNRWKSNIKHQSTISSYNTTKQSQLETVSSSVKLAQLIQTRCDAIDQVISSYRKQINRLYPSERFGTVHKHYRTDSLRKKFKDAHAPVSKASKLVDETREEKKKADKSLLDARIECQNLELDETSSKSKLSKANDRMEKKQRELQTIDEKLTRAQDDLHLEEKIYYDKALEIYEKCREYEAERLNLIRQTLIEYLHAIYSTEYASNQDTIYEKLLATIESQQDTQADLDFWAEVYHVSLPISTNAITIESTTPKPRKSDATTSLTTIDETPKQSVAEPEDEQSGAEKSTTTKTKPKKKRTTAQEPTSPDAN